MPVVLGHVGSGTYEPLQIAPVVALGAAYAIRARTLSHRGTPVPTWRAWCFAGGLVLILTGLISPASHLGEELLLAHMAQHLLIGDLAALLIVLGLTGPLLQPLLAIRAIERLRALTHPAPAFALWTANLYLWHLPALYHGALTSAPLHALQHAAFVGFGVLMWIPLFGPLPTPAWFGNAPKLVYILAVRLTGAVLANVFMWSGTVFYPDYAPGEATWHLSPLADQGTAGVIMMIEGSLVTLGLFAWLFFRAAGQGEERQRLLDWAHDRGIELDEERAGRAVAAGRGDELRERLEAR
jgi:cytochrome c oxidase assembly factor CtaG